MVPRDDDKLQLVKLALGIVCNPNSESKEVRYTSGAHFINWINFNNHGVKDEINFPFPNFNGCTVEFCEAIKQFYYTLMMDQITYE